MAEYKRVKGDYIIQANSLQLNLEESIGFESMALSDLDQDRLIFTQTGGLLSVDNNLLYDGNVLTAPSLTVSDLTQGRVLLAGASGQLEDSSNLTFDGTELSVPEIAVGDLDIAGTTISSSSSTITIDPSVGSSSGKLVVSGDLEVLGTTTTVDSTTVTIADPVLSLGEYTDDSLDRGIVAKYSTDGIDEKQKFFGIDRSTDEFVYMPDATGTGNVYSGDLGPAAFENLRLSAQTVNRLAYINSSGVLTSLEDISFESNKLDIQNITQIQDLEFDGGEILNLVGDTVLNTSGNQSVVIASGSNFRVHTNSLYVDRVSNFVGIGNTDPQAELDISGTGGIRIPTGTNAQRPGSPNTGTIRYNSTQERLEVFDGDFWTRIGDFTTIESYNFTADGISDTFVLGSFATTNSALVSVDGIVQTPGATYTIENGFDLTFNTPPADGADISVRILATSEVITEFQDGGAKIVLDDANDQIKLQTAGTDRFIVGNNGGLFASGSASNPSISFIDDENTGIFRPSSNTMAFSTNGVERFRLNNSGRAGFGTSDPGALVEIRGINTSTQLVRFRSSTNEPSIPAIIDIVATNTNGDASQQSHIVSYQPTGGSSTDSALDFRVRKSGDDFNNPSIIMTLLGSGNVGIGTSSPDEKLEVDGNIKATSFIGSLTGNADTVTALQTARTIGGVSFDGTANINLPGVNTTGNQNTTGSAATLTTTRTLWGQNFNGSSNVTGNLSDVGNITLGTQSNKATITYTTNTARTYTIPNAGANADFVMTEGNQTINGTKTFTSTIIGTATEAQYADLAENYLADADIEPGTVVDFGGDYEVTVSAKDHSRKIAGVVTTNPAHLMNSMLEGEYVAAVALTGRVPVKVQGKIVKGDMLVSAGNGRARAEEDPKMGAVIGKALENFDGDEGVIEVVVGRL